MPMWEAIGEDGEVLYRTIADDDMQADDNIIAYINRLPSRISREIIRKSWRSTGYRVRRIVNGSNGRIA